MYTKNIEITSGHLTKDAVLALPQILITNSEPILTQNDLKPLGTIVFDRITGKDYVTDSGMILMLEKTNEVFIGIFTNHGPSYVPINEVPVRNITPCIPLLSAVMSRECAAIICAPHTSAFNPP